MAPLPLRHTTAPDLLCRSPYTGANRITCEALKNARAEHYISVCGTKKAAVNGAPLKQGMASLCCRNGPVLCGSLLSSKLRYFFSLLCYLALPSGCLVYCCGIPGQVKKTKTKTRQIHAHVTAPISEGRYVRATMCSHYLVTVLCWAYSNWAVFPSCKMKTPCLLSVTTTSVFCSLWLSYFLGLADPFLW